MSLGYLLYWITLCSLFACIGLGMEVAFTATRNVLFRKNKSGMGYSSIWYAPLYACAPVFFFLFHTWLFAFPWFLRGLLYVASIFAVEYCGMSALRILLGKSPSESEYRRSRWNIHGLIRLDYAPLWFLAGFAFEYAFLFISL
ncbi:MAG: hypothetical protein Q7R79_02335 [bacterium]|nr:hypothetical protein [bacterium]